MVLLAIGLGLLVWFALRVRRDPGRAYNGMLLLVALGVTWLGLVLTLEQVGLRTAALLLGVSVFLLGPLAIVVASFWLVANGIRVIRREGLRTSTILPLAFGLGSIGVLVFTFVVPALPGVPPWVMAASALMFLVYAYLGFHLVAYSAYALVYSYLPELPTVDAVVMLGAGLGGGERVTPLLAGRLERGLAVRDRQMAKGIEPPILITSGGQGDDELLPEAEAMANWLRERSVPADQIRQERQSRTTEQNLAFSRDLLGHGPEGSLVVVATSNYHVLRTAALARKLGLDWKVVGSPTASYYAPTAFLREFIAHLSYAWRWHAAVGALVLMGVGMLALISGMARM